MKACLTTCPICGSKAVGRVANKQFYCSDCFNEINVAKEDLHVYAVLEDGTLELRTISEAKYLYQVAVTNS